MPKEMPKLYRDRVKWYKNLQREKKGIEEAIEMFHEDHRARVSLLRKKWDVLSVEEQIQKAKVLKEDLKMERMENARYDCLVREMERIEKEVEAGPSKDQRMKILTDEISEIRGRQLHKEDTGTYSFLPHIVPKRNSLGDLREKMRLMK